MIGWSDQSDDFYVDLRQQAIVFLPAQQRDQTIDQYVKTQAGINGKRNVARQQSEQGEICIASASV